MSQIQQFRLATSTASGTLVAAVVGKPIKVWKIIASGNGTFTLSDSVAGQVLNLLISGVTVVQYDGSPHLYVQPGDSLVLTSTVTTGFINVYYTQGG